MSQKTVKTENADPPSDRPLAQLMSHSTMHIDLAACIRNLLWGIAAIVLAAQPHEIDLTGLLTLWSGN